MKEILSVVGFIIAGMLVGISIWLFKSYNEARVYSELTGKQVTMSQAMWVELRVIEPAMRSEE